MALSLYIKEYQDKHEYTIYKICFNSIVYFVLLYLIGILESFYTLIYTLFSLL